ncbi:hypothetical protein V1478_011805, partial [Vespula squamosa]
ANTRVRGKWSNESISSKDEYLEKEKRDKDRDKNRDRDRDVYACTDVRHKRIQRVTLDKGYFPRMVHRGSSRYPRAFLLLFARVPRATL